jgi:hypothetical protein
LLNAYRVLLIRARQGVIVFVPSGDPSDPTRAPLFYDDTYQYLMGPGVADVGVEGVPMSSAARRASGMSPVVGAEGRRCPSSSRHAAVTG